MLEPGSDAAKAYAMAYAKLEEKAADAEMRAVMNRAEIGKLAAKLEQIAAVCHDNAPPSCDKGMALDFVRQVAESK
ncbi:hypothetical protein ASD45_08650 [Pseudolabrys sp. Root1462]|uniref:hypothetical protein n=1 Tax=Pseudolabrys sp. Root1462 TaxID=1736466 RepID=UPI0007024B9D|nr:hypothetical protein [Pseudolabrys sp. Root1462]KQZ00922.1 hypothetical protein ASD45_08650 [Pseudolabrys sp. Root1462]